jgi:hypothetical protein
MKGSFFIIKSSKMGRTSKLVPKEWTKGFGALCVIF